jgi:hypothetical protein
MAKFLDKTGQEWSVDLDVLKIEEIQSDHGVKLTDLERDPLLKFRTDPMALCSAILVICREQRERIALTREDFVKRLPSPPDAMLEAMTEALIDFFPSGRASHVRAVLSQMAEMGSKADEIAASKLAIVVSDPQVIAKLRAKADALFESKVQTILN